MSVHTISELCAIFQKRNASKETEHGFTTGFSGLDNYFDDSSKGLLLLGSRPAMGKTSFVLQVICNHIVREEEFVSAVITRNSSPDAVCVRLISMLSGVTIERIQEGCFDIEESELIEQTIEFLGNKKIYVIDSPLTENEIMETMDKIKRNTGRLDFVVIDGLGDIQPDYLNYNISSAEEEFENPYGCSNDMISINSNYYVEICQSLRQIALDMDCHMVVTVTLSRLVESRTNHFPELMDMRNYGRIYEAADRVLLLYREEYYRTDKDVRKGLMNVVIAKNNTGRTGVIELKLNQKTTGISETDHNVGKPSDFWMCPDDIDEDEDDVLLDLGLPFDTQSGYEDGC